MRMNGPAGLDPRLRSLKAPPVVVIGAGASGLTAVKSCLEAGLDVVCFEKTDYTGGLWRYKEEVVDGVASVMRTTVINSCKELSAYSDFPPPSEFANYMHNRDQVKYLDMYTEKFDLRRHIFFLYEVNNIRQNPDFKTSGQWTVTVTNKHSNEQKEIIASAVMVSNGHHSYPHIPTFSGLSDFKGQVLHTHSYKDQKPFEDKRVVIIGIGNSGGDIAVELGRASSKVYLSTRRGTWIINRVGVRGMPTDYLSLRRFITGPNALLPERVVTYFAQKLHQQRFDHALYNLKPNHGFFSQHPMVNDSLPNSILSGTVIIKNDIHSFTSDGVIFKGEESTVYPVDVVILATGYDIRYPFIDKDLLPVNDNKVHLYKYMFPPRIQPPTMAVIGLIQPLGSIVPISELQSRLAVSVFKKETKLPTSENMEKDIERLTKEMLERYAASRRHTIQVDYMTYMDDIGSLMGVVPNLRKLFFTDPVLWFYCFFGANLPYQYRLTGPYPWPGARKAIIEGNDRVIAPLQTRKPIQSLNHWNNNNVESIGHIKNGKISSNSNKGYFYLFVMAFVVLVGAVIFAYFLFSN